MNRSDGMNYAPQGKKVSRVVENGEFPFAAMGLDHGEMDELLY